MTDTTTRCRCGHIRDAHEHYRPGTDCSDCRTCPKFRAATGLRARLARLLGRDPQPARPVERGVLAAELLAELDGCHCLACQVDWPTDEHDADDQRTTHYRAAGYVGRHRIETVDTHIALPAIPRQRAHLN